MAAIASALVPSGATSFTFAPRSSSTLGPSMCPFRTANRNGRKARLGFCFHVRANSISSAAASALPSDAAHISSGLALPGFPGIHVCTARATSNLIGVHFARSRRGHQHGLTFRCRAVRVRAALHEALENCGVANLCSRNTAVLSAHTASPPSRSHPRAGSRSTISALSCCADPCSAVEPPLPRRSHSLFCLQKGAHHPRRRPSSLLRSGVGHRALHSCA